jgi:hypothetical protein
MALAWYHSAIGGQARGSRRAPAGAGKTVPLIDKKGTNGYNGGRFSRLPGKQRAGVLHSL